MRASKLKKQKVIFNSCEKKILDKKEEGEKFELRGKFDVSDDTKYRLICTERNNKIN